MLTLNDTKEVQISQLLHFLVLVLTGWGLASWLNLICSFCKKEIEKWRGLSFFISLCSIPLILLIGNSVFKIPLHVLSFILFILAVIGFIVELFFKAVKMANIKYSADQQGHQSQLKKSNFKFLLHPVYLFTLGVIVFFSINGFYPYYAHRWDEFSHWLLMPKQIFLYDQVTSFSFPVQQFITYTPGWPLFLAYPDLVLTNIFNYQNFHSQGSLFALFLLTLALLFFMYDFICDCVYEYANDYVDISSTYPSLVAWCGMLFILYRDPLEYFFPLDILIETPLLLLLLGSFLLIYMLIKKRISDGLGLTFLSLVVASGYLLKKPFIAIIPSLIILSFFLSIRKRKIFPWFVLVPILFIHYYWKYLMAAYPPLFHLQAGMDTILPRLHFIFKLLIALKQEIFSGEWTNLLFRGIGFSSLLVSLVIPGMRIFAGTVLTFLVVYFLGIYWLYVTTFEYTVAASFVSFPRYIGFAINAVSLVGVGVFLSLLIKFIFPRIKSFMTSKLDSCHLVEAVDKASKVRKDKFKTIIMAVIVLAILLNTFKLGKRMYTTFCFDIKAVEASRFERFGENLSKELIKRNRVGDQLKYITKEFGSNAIYFALRYSSLTKTNIPGNNQAFQVQEEYSLDAHNASEEILVNDLISTDVILIDEGSAELNKVLSKIVDLGSCPGIGKGVEFKDFFLFKKKEQKNVSNGKEKVLALGEKMPRPFFCVEKKPANEKEKKKVFASKYSYLGTIKVQYDR